MGRRNDAQLVLRVPHEVVELAERVRKQAAREERDIALSEVLRRALVRGLEATDTAGAKGKGGRRRGRP